MGIYLNPEIENFKETLSHENYVDKIEIISLINHFIATEYKYICISLPRRFGKIITGNMLSAYYLMDQLV